MGKPALGHPAVNQIAAGREPPELKHLSRARKRHQPRVREWWRAKAEEAKPKVAISSGLRTAS